MNHIIHVDLSSDQSILDTLDHIFNNYEHIARDSFENSGIEFYDQLTGNLIILENSIHPEIPNYSELAFYLKVIKTSGSIEKLKKITQIVIHKNSIEPVLMNEEIPMGLSVVFALAFHDKRYISDFVTVLRTFDLNHEVYESIFIELLLNKWKICDETLFLLAARSGSLSGQWGIEGYDIPKLNTVQKNTFLTYLLEDTLSSKTIFTDLLLDAIQFLNITVDQEKFKSFFDHYKPLFDKSNIPSLSHIE